MYIKNLLCVNGDGSCFPIYCTNNLCRSYVLYLSIKIYFIVTSSRPIEPTSTFMTCWSSFKMYKALHLVAYNNLVQFNVFWLSQSYRLLLWLIKLLTPYMLLNITELIVNTLTRMLMHVVAAHNICIISLHISVICTPFSYMYKMVNMEYTPHADEENHGVQGPFN